MIARAVCILSAVFVCLGMCAHSRVSAVTIQEIVDQVSQASYTDYLNTLLYTHRGDNRDDTGGPQHDPCADNCFVQLRRFGITTYYDPFTWTTGGMTYNMRNVVGVKQGIISPDDIYVVGAHYDSVGNAGADDNGSGVAGVLEAARVLAPHTFAKTMIFAIFDNEEGSHGGSKHMVSDLAAHPPKGMISIDMIAWNDPSNRNKAYCYSRTPQSDSVRASLQSMVSLYGNGLTFYYAGVTTGSDHEPFETAGLPAAYFCEDDKNPYWHNVNDTVDTTGYIDYAYGTKFVRCTVGWLATNAGLIQ